MLLGIVQRRSAAPRSVLTIVFTRSPPDSINQKYFKPSAKNLHTRCPWKGDASYYDVHLDDGKVLPDVAWYYPKLTTERSQKMKFEGYIAFYTARGVKVE